MGSKVIFGYDSLIKPKNVCPRLVKSSQSNLNLQSPDCYLVCSYLITTVHIQGPKKGLLQCFAYIRLGS